MKKLFILATILLLTKGKDKGVTALNGVEAAKEISLKAIWNGTFSTDRLVLGTFYAYYIASKKINLISNDIIDWVCKEKFGFVRAFERNKNSKKIAFLHFDETNVPTFFMDILDAENYLTQQIFKYTKAVSNRKNEIYKRKTLA